MPLRRTLRSARFRLRPRAASDSADSSVAAEKGYLHEFGNLVFHLSLLVLLVGVAWGSWFGYRGTVVIVEGEGFANTLTQYDDFVPGRGFSTSLLAPFSFTMDEFDAKFLEEGPNRGQPDQYTADVTYRENPDADQQTERIEVNKPLNINGSKVFLLGHGYAPAFTVRDGDGDVVFSGAVPALPQDPTFTSTTVVKVPDAQPEQLGFNVTATPTAPDRVDPATGPESIFPEANDPRVYLGAWAGDLGLDSGVPQNVYRLDSSAMEQLGREDLAVGRDLGAARRTRLDHLRRARGVRERAGGLRPGALAGPVGSGRCHGRDLAVAAGTSTPGVGACEHRRAGSYARRGGRAGPD